MEALLTPTSTATHKTRTRLKEHGPLADIRSKSDIIKNDGDDSWYCIFPDGHSRWVKKHEVEVRTRSSTG